MISEVWATAFMLGSMTLLVFALGLPAVVLELTVPPEVRVILQKHGLDIGRVSVAVSLMGGVVLCYVWWLNGAGILGGWMPGWLGAGLFTCGLIGVVGYWWRQLRWTRRRMIVSFLAKKAVQRMERDPLRGYGLTMGPEYRWLDRDVMEGLALLGDGSTSRSDREDLLEWYRKLAQGITEPPGYEGDQLSMLIGNVTRVAGSGRAAVSEEELEISAEILEGIVRKRGVMSRDCELAIGGLGKVGAVALRAGHYGVARRIVQELAGNTTAGRESLQLAREAIGCRRFDVALLGMNGMAGQIGMGVGAARDGGERYQRGFFLCLLGSCIGGGVELERFVVSVVGQVFEDSGEAIRDAEALFRGDTEFELVDLIGRVKAALA